MNNEKKRIFNERRRRKQTDWALFVKDLRVASARQPRFEIKPSISLDTIFRDLHPQ
jgi:hypothetical protein